MIRTYRDLEVWQVAMDLAVACYTYTCRFPKEEAFGLTGQIRRSAGSVPANVAEGHGRDHVKEYLHHLSIARGSLLELETHVILSGRVGLLAKPAEDELLALSQRVGQMLSRLQQSLQRNSQNR